jgi:hypothetical protein
VAPPLQGGVFRQEGWRVRSAVRSACRELHPSSPSRSRRAVHPSAAHLVEQRMTRQVVLPTQRRRPAVEVFLARS